MPQLNRLTLALALAAGLSLTGCGNTPAPETNVGANTQADAGPPPQDMAATTDAWPPPEPNAAPQYTAAATMAGDPSQMGGGNGSGGLQRVPVVDPNGFEKPMPALWVQVPAGWKTNGGVVWNQQALCGANPVFQWQAQSPDGSRSLQMLPSEAWTWDNLGMDIPGGSCPRWPITDVRAYLQSYVQRHRAGARVLDYRARNDLVRSAPPPSTPQSRYWKEGGEVLIAYNGQNGEVRESIAAVVMFNETTMAGVMPGEVRKFLSGMAASPVSARAPSGQLDMALLTHFANSAETDPQWQARMNKHNTAIARQGVEGQIDRGQIISDTNREIADINQRGWDSRNASGDGMHRDNVDSINNVDRYTDPVTGNEVQLDNRYDNAWRTQDGNYVQTNDPNFNPQAELGVDAEQMERSDD